MEDDGFAEKVLDFLSAIPDDADAGQIPAFGEVVVGRAELVRARLRQPTSSSRSARHRPLSRRKRASLPVHRREGTAAPMLIGVFGAEFGEERGEVVDGGADVYEADVLVRRVRGVAVVGDVVWRHHGGDTDVSLQ